MAVRSPRMHSANSRRDREQGRATASSAGKHTRIIERFKRPRGARAMFMPIVDIPQRLFGEPAMVAAVGPGPRAYLQKCHRPTATARDAESAAPHPRPRRARVVLEALLLCERQRGALAWPRWPCSTGLHFRAPRKDAPAPDRRAGLAQGRQRCRRAPASWEPRRLQTGVVSTGLAFNVSDFSQESMAHLVYTLSGLANVYQVTSLRKFCCGSWRGGSRISGTHEDVARRN
jgi:hypothetical protein